MFKGFPAGCITFYEGLEADNSKSYWTANKEIYETCVRAPMEALVEDLEQEFGAAKIFRPYRDTRFSADKSPYKTNIAVSFGMDAGAGHYLSLSADALMAAAGCYGPDAPMLARFRKAVADERKGTELEALVKGLERQRYEVGGEALKRAPKGFDPDHPRIRLLRHKSLYAHKGWPPGKWLHSAKAKDRVVETFRAAGPLNAWLTRHVTEPSR